MTGRWLVHLANCHSSCLPHVSLCHTDLYFIELHMSLCFCMALELFWENYCLSDKIIYYSIYSIYFSIYSPKTEYFFDLLFLIFSGSQEIISCSQQWWIYMHATVRNSKQVSPWQKKNKWKPSYKSRANCITDATKHIKTSLISCEHHKNHIKHAYTARQMSDKGQGGFEPQLHSVNVDIQSPAVKQRSLVMQSIYLWIPLRQCFKTPCHTYLS